MRQVFSLNTVSCKWSLILVTTTHSFSYLADTELLTVLQEAEGQIVKAKSSGYFKRSPEEYQESETVWKKRMELKEKEFSEQRTKLHSKLQEHMCSLKIYTCVGCNSFSSDIVRCQSCRQHLCGHCDQKKHCILFTHRRTYLFSDILYILGPTEFIDINGAISITGTKRLH